MDIMIILKWLTNYKGYEDKAPGIISTMSNIFLDGGRVDGWQLFPGHTAV
jgi:hypothetical protein